MDEVFGQQNSSRMTIPDMKSATAKEGEWKRLQNLLMQLLKVCDQYPLLLSGCLT
jgi:hypothetical protein